MMVLQADERRIIERLESDDQEVAPTWFGFASDTRATPPTQQTMRASSEQAIPTTQQVRDLAARASATQSIPKYDGPLPHRPPWLQDWFGPPRNEEVVAAGDTGLKSWFTSVDRKTSAKAAKAAVPPFKPCSIFSSVPEVEISLTFTHKLEGKDVLQCGLCNVTLSRPGTPSYNGPEQPMSFPYVFGFNNVVTINAELPKKGCCGCCNETTSLQGRLDLATPAFQFCKRLKTWSRAGSNFLLLEAQKGFFTSRATPQECTVELIDQKSKSRAMDIKVAFNMHLKVDSGMGMESEALFIYLRVVSALYKITAMLQNTIVAHTEGKRYATHILQTHFVSGDDKDTPRHCAMRWAFPEQYAMLLGCAVEEAKVSSPELMETLWATGMQGSPLGMFAAFNSKATYSSSDTQAQSRFIGHWLELFRSLRNIMPDEQSVANVLDQLKAALVARASSNADFNAGFECLCICALARDFVLGIDALAVAKMHNFDIGSLPSDIGAKLVGPMSVVVSSIDAKAGKEIRSADWHLSLVKCVLKGCIKFLESIADDDVEFAIRCYRQAFWSAAGRTLQSAKHDLTEIQTALVTFLHVLVRYYRKAVEAEFGFFQRTLARVVGNSSDTDTPDSLDWFRKIDSLLRLRKNLASAGSSHFEEYAEGEAAWPDPSPNNASGVGDQDARDFAALLCLWALGRSTRRALKETLIIIVDSCTEPASGVERRLELARSYVDAVPEMKQVMEAYRSAQKVPDDWDILAMVVAKKKYNADESSGGLRFSDGERENLLRREACSEGQTQFFQALLGNTHKSRKTRDRSGGKLPASFKVVAVTKVANDKSWVQYQERCENIRRQRSWQRLSSGCAWPTETTHEPITKAAVMAASESCAASSPLPDLDPGVNEAWLWHGTSATAAENISMEDFNLDFSGSGRGSLYGKGIYLAESCTKSDEYAAADSSGARHLLLCRAALGRVRYIDGDNFDADTLPSSCHGFFASWDSVLGDREKLRGTYREFIVYDNDQVYPNFIVKYKRVYH